MISAAELLRVRVILVSARNPLNIGAAARAMSNFGFSRLRLVTPYQVAFRHARSAVGAADLLARAEEFGSLAEAIGDCSLVVGTTAVGHRDPQQPLQPLEAGARLIREKLGQEVGREQELTVPRNAENNIALLFGSEKRGLSNEEMSHCDWLMHIPTTANHLSMNLGQAVAVCLYELTRDGEIAAPIRKPDTGHQQASSEEVERLSTVLLEALLTSSYMDEDRQASTAQIVRGLARRMKLSSGDARLLLGMLRQMLWKMRAADLKSKRQLQQGPAGAANKQP